MNIVNYEDIINIGVENQQGEDLGKIEAVMLDKLTGNIAYVVLSFGGFLGMGNKLFAFPWHLFTYSPQRDKFITPLTKEKLKNAQGFDKNNWPDMSSKDWLQTMRDYYGDRPSSTH